VNPIQLLGIIKNADHLSKDDFNDLIRLHETFPYFQIPKVLLAKYEFTKTVGNSKELLPWASITSPDRSWLKKMVETSAPFETIIKKIEDQMDAALLQKNQEAKVNLIEELEDQLIPEPQKKSTNKDLTATLRKLGEDLALSKMKAMEKLEKIENKSEEVINDQEKQKPAESEDNFALPVTVSSQIEPPKPTVVVLDGIEKEKPSISKRKVSKDELIESIRRKDKKEILDKKKQEQIDIIKAFSKKEIKLATLKELEGQQKQDDLSEKSTKLNPDLITESYAKLLVKQGKNNKAKEIYKKLMMKFPDKNTYFANRLKELEENNP
jgi:hypothetical protein